MKLSKSRTSKTAAAGDEYATPWDEPERYWGRRGDNPLRLLRKAFQRERFFGTW